MKKNIKRVLAFTLTAAALLGAAGCGGSSKTAAQSGTAESASADSPRQVLIGIRQDLFPTSYIDEKGEPQGYDIDIIKKIDEKLPQYEFTYEAVSQEALLTGLESGKYAAAVAGFYTSDERQEKYLFPQEPIGGNLIGLLVKTSDADQLKDLASLAKSGKTLEPIASTSGMYGIVVEYNKENPDNQVDLQTSDWTDASEQFKYLEEGRYDAVVTSQNVYDQIKDELGYDDLTLNIFTAIKTWSMFNKSETQLAADYDKALKELKDEGYITEESKKYFGQDILPYIEEQAGTAESESN